MVRLMALSKACATFCRLKIVCIIKLLANGLRRMSARGVPAERENAEMAKGKKRIVQAGRLLLGSIIADNKQRTPCVNYFESLR